MFCTTYPLTRGRYILVLPHKTSCKNVCGIRWNRNRCAVVVHDSEERVFGELENIAKNLTSLSLARRKRFIRHAEAC